VTTRPDRISGDVGRQVSYRAGMRLLSVPFHLDEALDPFDLGAPADADITAELPPGDPWTRMAVLYEQVAEAVGSGPVVVASGDCTTSLGVLAGLQRAGRDPAVVWFDAHADFHTVDTTTSGYLGGMPLALAVGRDTDPGEQRLLADSAVTRTTVADLGPAVPDGDLYVHVDVDVCTPGQVPDLLYPAEGGSAVDELLTAVRQLVATGRVAALGLAATWHHRTPPRPEHAALVRGLLAAVGG
jgi:arginase